MNPTDFIKKHKEKYNRQQRGSTLADGQQHTQDHKNWSRRSFLGALGITGSMGMMFSKVPLAAMAASPLSVALNNSETDNILVMIRLKGGNDGLNTIIPLYDYSTYLSRRPTLGFAESQLTNLSSEFAMPNHMNALHPMWQDGKMKVINNVGYPEANLSHFRSSDIWATSSDANVVVNTGWLGRFLEDQYPDFIVNPPASPPAIQIGSVSDLAFKSAAINMAFAVTSPDELYQIAQNGSLYDVQNLPDCMFGDQLGYLRSVANSTVIYAEAIKEAYDAGANSSSASYTTGYLSQQLSLVARLIKGNLGTKLYMVELDGFDTHAAQGQAHADLMTEIANTVEAFYQDLAATDNWDEKVISMTFSEFGRRIEENASWGTDHGTAAPTLLFGSALEGNGFIGDNPDMQNADWGGNLIYSTDFRSVYSTLLQNWLCLDAATTAAVLGQDFPTLEGVVNNSVGINRIPNPPLAHQALYDRSSGKVVIEYDLEQTSHVNLQIYNMAGQLITTLANTRQLPGKQRVPFDMRRFNLPATQCLYRLEINGFVYSKPIMVLR